MTLPAIRIGAQVIVLTLGKKQGTVLAVGRDGRYQVRVERITMWCREMNLALPPSVKAKKAHEGAVRAVETLATSAPPAVRVDLHGLRVEEAIARVITEMDTALVRGAERMEIVHGKGEGRLKAALHRELKRLSVVKAFELDTHNAGVTWVYF